MGLGMAVQALEGPAGPNGARAQPSPLVGVMKMLLGCMKPPTADGGVAGQQQGQQAGSAYMVPPGQGGHGGGGNGAVSLSMLGFELRVVRGRQRRSEFEHFEL
jgi:hypothetical protein